MPMDAIGCKYAGFCRFYQKDGHDCADEDRAETYCGTFEVFADFEPDKSGLYKKILVR
jgi:hypothetical protein